MTDESIDFILRGMLWSILACEGYEIEDFAKGIDVEDMFNCLDQIEAEKRDW